VAVRTGKPGFGGISFLLIERSMPGVTTRQMNCSGVWSSGTAYITFEDVKVPKSHVIGKVDKGFKYIMQSRFKIDDLPWRSLKSDSFPLFFLHNVDFNPERIGCVIQANRFARVCIEEAITYGNKRETFGKKLIDHPVIRNKLVSEIESPPFFFIQSSHSLQMFKL
jgi:alkylation response protein AidB-like acyl-CoA dehydrogenase